MGMRALSELPFLFRSDSPNLESTQHELNLFNNSLNHRSRFLDRRLNGDVRIGQADLKGGRPSSPHPNPLPRERE